MIVDSSALVEILLSAPEGPRMLSAIIKADTRSISAPNWLETAMVFESRTVVRTSAGIDSLVNECGIAIIPFDAKPAILAREAFHRFGRGNHPAKLNSGDCIAYALAKHTGEPLLFKGHDFTQIDITPALAA